MEKKRIWLVSHYAMPPRLEVRVKTIRFAKILQRRGYDVTLVTASTIHNSDVNLIEDKSLYVEREYDGLRYVHIRCDGYRGSGVKRILNMFQFQNRFAKAMKRFAKPDAIVADCNCINYRGILKYARKNKIAFVSEIRDLWPLSIVEYKNISASNPIIRYLYGQEKRMYKLSDAIIFSMEGGKDYIRDKGWEKQVDLDKVFYINNRIDGDQIVSQVDTDMRADGVFRVVYAGSIRQVNDLDTVLDCAKLLGETHPWVRFDLYGDGDQRERLEKRCADEQIANVRFLGSVPKEAVGGICRSAQLNLINVQPSGISRYGVSWNKLFDYMAAGRPILSTLKVRYDLIDRYRCGISTEEQTPQAIADAIVEIAELPQQEYTQMCERARAAATDFDFETLTDRLEAVVQYACERKEK